MLSLFKPGQVLPGRLSTYTLVKELSNKRESWLTGDQTSVFLATNEQGKNCIVKGAINTPRIKSEANTLRRFTPTCDFLRPVEDEIIDPDGPQAIVLKYHDTNLRDESIRKRLSRFEIKVVARTVLEALRDLHSKNMIHTYVAPEHVFVSLAPKGEGQGTRFSLKHLDSPIQLGGCGGVVPEGSKHSSLAQLIGSSLTRSPEAQLILPWTRATDIWSFGNLILELLYGEDFHLFDPMHMGVAPGAENYEMSVLLRMHRFFGPFPDPKFPFTSDAHGGQNAFWAVNWVDGWKPPKKPFWNVPAVEIPEPDKEFLLRIMHLDYRERPTAEELLEDDWFHEESSDTRRRGPKKWSSS